MREALFILAILLVMLGLTAYRYRKQIAAVYRFWTMIRGAGPEQGQIQQNQNDVESLLVRCAKCGVLTPKSRAIKFGGEVFYCSVECMER